VSTKSREIPISVSAAVDVPAVFAFSAVERILEEFALNPADASLALNVRELHLPFEVLVSVPIRTNVRPGNSRNEWHVEIYPVSNPQLYPTFEGVLTLVPAARSGTQIELSGGYSVPFGMVGHAIDLTLFRGAAASSLRRFVREIAHRVAALSHWVEQLSPLEEKL
jgi:hypothetical protein